MSSLHLRIISYIEKHSAVEYNTLLSKALEHGYSEFDFEEAITCVHKDRRIAVTSELLYTYKEPKPRNDMTSHLVWLRENYPQMNDTNDGSGIEADYSYMFLSPQELEEYRATIKGGRYPLTWARKKTKYNHSH